MNRCASFVTGVAACLLASFAYQQDPSKPATAEVAKPADPIEAERAKMLDSMAGLLVKPADVLKAVEEKGDLKKASNAELASLASDCNRAANLIGVILSEYDSYERDNYRYDVILKQVREKRLPMETLRQRLLGSRNSIYFEQAVRLRDAGSGMLAFLTFRDAFRLSPFEGDGMRLKAEQEMKQLLGMADLPSFVEFK